MKKFFLFPILLAAAFFSCNDPIFYTVAIQPPLNEPRLKGSPTKFAVHGNAMYVASGNKLWQYDTGVWKSEKSFPSLIADIAITDNGYFYVRLSDTSDQLHWSTDGVNFTAKPMSVNIQSIFSAGNYLYISARDFSITSGNYSIYHLLGSGDPVPVTPDISSDEITRVSINSFAFSGSTFYFCSYGSGINSSDMKGKGIFSGTLGSTSVTRINDSDDFTGILYISGGEFAAISRSGQLYKVTGTTVTALSDVSLGRPSNSMGTLALWSDYVNVQGTNTLVRILLAGTQDITNTANTSHTHGFMELELSPSGTLDDTKRFNWPGEIEPISTMTSRESFITTLGKHGVNHLYQYVYPDNSQRVLFASTQQEGLWSYRDRGGSSGWHWNAEE
ncbi:MAG: hypothetical protein FWC01_04575 [Treponema sp.]|nr:hypothetical protein [Treponema sp.]MCL2237733.1 hypothetical protein [Treponema sp.]